VTTRTAAGGDLREDPFGLLLGIIAAYALA
jgi:hypothetical protein